MNKETPLNGCDLQIFRTTSRIRCWKKFCKICKKMASPSSTNIAMVSHLAVTFAKPKECWGISFSIRCLWQYMCSSQPLKKHLVTCWNWSKCIQLIDIIYLEPKWPLFLKVNPPEQGLFQSKQGSFGFQIPSLTRCQLRIGNEFHPLKQLQQNMPLLVVVGELHHLIPLPPKKSCA